MKKIVSVVIFFVFYFQHTGFVFSQTNSDPKSSAELLTNLNDWCSGNAAYSTSENMADQPLTKCNSNSLRFAKWFKFKATTSSIEIKVKIGAAEGTLHFPYISLRDESLNELSCLQYNDEQEDIVLNYSELTEGKTYYFSVNNHNHSKYAGTFTLCLTDVESNDFSVGAIKLWSLNDWCSEKSEFTTLAATPDGNASSCIPKGPNFNTWFIFQAVQPGIEISVKSGGSFGTAKFPIVTLWDENMKELACNNLKKDISEASLKFGALKGGNIYYLSVDHIYNDKYQGSFTLCAKEDNSSPSKNLPVVSDLVFITGKLYKKSGVVTAQRVVLLNEKGEPISNTTTDAKGKFRFPDLISKKNYLVKIDSEEKIIDGDVFMVNEKGEILKKTLRDKNIFRFDELPPNCNFFSLVDCSNPDIKIAEGKIGILGKMLSKKDPVDPVAKQWVFLLNSPHKILDSAITDPSGKFQFLNYPANQTYLLRLGEPQEENYTEVVMMDSKGKAIMSASSKTIDSKGFFRFETLPAMEPDPIKLKSAMDERIDLSNLTEGSKFQDNKIIIMKQIYFESGEYRLLEKSFEELNRLVKILNENSLMKIEISGHTDNSGNETSNLHLSENRAKSVVEYLISKGVKNSQLSYVGMGSSMPISQNNNEENKQKNRRVEFKVLK